MEEPLACRACLATDTKLFNLFNNELVILFQNLTGFQLLPTDRLPRHICSYCTALLLKCSTFQNRCRTAQHLLELGLMEEPLLTKAYIDTIDRESFNLKHQLTTQNINEDSNILLTNIIGSDTNIKTENDSSSDEEPLSNIKNKIEPLDCQDEDDRDDINNYYNNEINIKEEVLEKPVVDNLISVVYLSKDEQIQDLKARQDSMNYKRSLFKCELCYKGFITKSTYQTHMERHDPKYGRFPCDVCHIRWNCKRALHTHINTTHSKNYICKICGQITKNLTKSKEHLKWHQGFKYSCDVCGATFSKSTSHLTHVRIHHPSSTHICDICQMSFISDTGLQLHKKKMHKINGSSQLKTTCTLCGLKFDNPEALEVHMTLVVNDTCSDNVCPCLFCGENFTNEELLKEHSRIHQDDTCFECNKKFVNARVKAAHYQEIHLGMKRRKAHRQKYVDWVCEICGRTCMSKASLMVHQRTHTGEKPYSCTECCKRFSVLQRLQIHMRMHTDERPFKCTHCLKAFRHKAALNRHNRVHTGIKPYVCPTCGKSFSQSNSVKTHIRTVHHKLPSLYRRTARKEDYSE